MEKQRDKALMINCPECGASLFLAKKKIQADVSITKCPCGYIREYQIEWLKED